MCVCMSFQYLSRVTIIVIVLLHPTLPNEQIINMNENPYSGHRLLSEKEQEVLGEYAKLAGTIRRVSVIVEMKMRLCVLTSTQIDCRFVKLSLFK